MTGKSATINVTPRSDACPDLKVAQDDNSAGVSVTNVSEIQQQLVVPGAATLTFVGPGLQNIECVPRSRFEVTIDKKASDPKQTGKVTVQDNGAKGKCVFMLKINGQWRDPQIYNTGGGGEPPGRSAAG